MLPMLCPKCKGVLYLERNQGSADQVWSNARYGHHNRVQMEDWCQCSTSKGSSDARQKLSVCTPILSDVQHTKYVSCSMLIIVVADK
jgi:hypothetical protein